MNLKQCFFTENECYKTAQKHTVKGIMVHSTGADNPNLKRYVQPNDGLLGENIYNNSMNRFRPDGRQVCPHAFIGKLADGSVATYQTLPFDIVGWHSGDGNKGNANYMGYLGFEICEDNTKNKEYFDKVYLEAVEFCAYLCEKFGLNPQTDIICHSEGHAKGIASNHGDVMHWFPIHGKSMDSFRNDVEATLKKTNSKETAENVEYSNEYTVKSGDTLWGIAQIFLKNGKRYTEIKEINGLTSDTIYSGQVLKLPNDSVSVSAFETTEDNETKIKVGDKVKLSENATIYGTNNKFASFVYSKELYLRELNGDRAVISTVPTGAVTGAVDVKYLIK